MMQSKTKLLLFLIFISNSIVAQRAMLNPQLYEAISGNQVSSRNVSLLAQGDNSIVESTTRSLGGTYKYSVNNISSITLPLNKLIDLAATSGITRIEGLQGYGTTLDDQTNINANINPVHLGYLPLAQAYDGSGVVVGMLDVGIEINHPDFQNADGTTRIKYLWDQNATTGGDTPQPYNYGQEWDAAAINAGQCTHTEPVSEFGHGSNTSGIAAGNGLAVNNFEGVAPKADIITVAILLDGNFLMNVVDGAEYAYTKAAALGEPCVLNASLGTYLGSHDGTDLAAQLIDDLLTEANGRAFVCAAGNAGNNHTNPTYIPLHQGYDAQPDSSFTWYKKIATSTSPHYNNAFFEWFIDADDAAGFNFALGADSVTKYIPYKRTKYYNLVNDFDFSNGDVTKKDTIRNGAILIGIVTITASKLDSSYDVTVNIKPVNAINCYWRFITNGTGRWDGWNNDYLTGGATSDIITSNLPDSITCPDIVRYKNGDYNQTIVSSFTCSDKVITVGNYTNRSVYFDFYGRAQTFKDTAGVLAASSSLGPTRDGRIKPEVSAPGDITLAPGQLSTLYTLLIIHPDKVAIGGLHNRNSGTSMASPVVAGVAALYLQKHPTASWKEVKDAITMTTFEDQYTGYNLPDNRYGYGKVDAFAALTSNIVEGCTDPFSINFNPAATVDDGTCIPVVFGCTDPSADNFNPSANMNDGTCVYTGITNLNPSATFFTCYPNPAHSSTTFYYNNRENENSVLTISDAEGKIIDKVFLSSSENQFSYHRQLSPGLYFCALQNKMIKLVVY